MTIPRTFHFVFGMRPQRGPFHLLHYLCLESCRQVNRPDAIRLYYHHEPHGPLWERIKPHLTLERVPLNPLVQGFRYDDENLDRWRYAHHSDFVRMEKLLEHGGIYADIDTLFIRPVPDHLFGHSFVMGHEGMIRLADGSQHPTLCNAFMMAEPGAAFGRLWLDAMGEAFDGSWSNHSTCLPYRLAMAHPELIHLEPRSSFFHFPPTIAGVTALFEGKHPIPDAAYSLHLWEHLWWNPTRIDFCRFHHGRFTYDYVAAQQTTVAAAAGRFLPPESVRQPWTETTTRLRAEASNILTYGILKFRSVIGYWFYLWLAKLWPSLQPRLKLARAFRIHEEGRKVLRFREPLEYENLIAVLYLDKYGILDTRLAPTDVVIDIGGHIGTFSFACHALGSRAIRVFEPVTLDADRLERHLGHLDGITLDRRAIYRSDTSTPPFVDLPSHSGKNTGSTSALLPGHEFDGEAVRLRSDEFSEPTVPVETLALDAVLATLPRVRLLKLDCEGNEYAILLTATLLHKVDRIVGEYHSIPAELMAELPAHARIDGIEAYGPDTIRNHLEAQGFAVRMSSHGSLGTFDAVRRK